MLSYEKWMWLQPPKWDVSILLEDPSEWDLGVVRAVLKPSGEVRVSVNAVSWRILFWSGIKEITVH